MISEGEELEINHFLLNKFDRAIQLKDPKNHDELSNDEVDYFKTRIIPKLEEIIDWYGRYPSPKIKNLKKPYLQEVFRVGINIGALSLTDTEVLLIKKVFFYFEN